MTTESRQNGPRQGYGNIYTPHAGDMIIHVHRASGLANRTFTLGPRAVKLLRRFASKSGVILGAIAAASWVFFAVQAARVPVLERQIKTLETDAARLDTLERTLVQLNQRYDQLQRILAATPAATPKDAIPVAPATTEH